MIGQLLIATAALLLSIGGLSNVCAQSKTQNQSKPQSQSSAAHPTSVPTNQSSGITEPVALETPTGMLHGTLQLPAATNASIPVALIIAGSGPTDRDGNSAMLPGANNSLKYLAEGLAARGIASVRYDKRGVAKSTVTKIMREDDLRFDTYVDDAVAWVKKLRMDKRFSTVTIIGHSEGSLIGMIAAERGGADAFVSIAGAGRPAPELILEQLGKQLSPELLIQSKEMMKELKAGRTVATVPAPLRMLFRESIQPYMISWFKYDPAHEVARLKIPVMVAQGTTDIQSSVEEAKLLQRAQPLAKLLLVEGMNHVLKNVSGDLPKQIPSYSDSTLPVVPELVEAISKFIKTVLKRA